MQVMKSRGPGVLAALGVMGGLAIVFACGSEPDVDGSSSGNSSSGASSTSASSSGGFGSSGASTSSSSGSVADANPANCIAPVDMYIMFDRSGSMGADCNIGDSTSSKWCRAITALSGYFKSAGAKDQGAALQMFPLPNHSDNSCSTGDDYHVAAAPATGYQTLPSNAFDALLNADDPDGNTPTEAAIRGISRFTAANRRGGRVTIGILITDGNPNGCNEDLTDLSNLLQAHHAATQVRTYVIGMQGASFDNLEEIAQGGNAPLHPDTVGAITDACGDGAGPCRHWNVGDGDPTVFAAALAAIQESADGCKDGGGFVNPVN